MALPNQRTEVQLIGQQGNRGANCWSPPNMGVSTLSRGALVMTNRLSQGKGASAERLIYCQRVQKMELTLL